MRLPFGLGRRSGSADGASSDGATAGFGSEGSLGSGATAPAASVPTRAWASLPAIQRTAGDMPLVAAPSHFVETLPGSHGLPPIVEPLGHEVSPLATPGLVVARTRAVEAPAAGRIPAPAPVQRRLSRSAAGTDIPSEAFDVFHDEPASSEAAAPAVAAAPVVEAAPAAPTPSSLAPAPIRTMPTVSRQAIRVPDRPLTSAAAAAQPAPIQRVAASTAGASVTPAAGTPTLPRPSGGMRRVPSPTVAPHVSREVAQPSTPTSPSGGQASVPVGRAPLRRGLGGPLTAAPASAKPVASVLAGPVVSRATTSGPLPIAASSLRPVAQRSAADADQPVALAAGQAGQQAGLSLAALPQPVLRLPHLPVSRSVDDAGPAPVAAAGAATTLPVSRGPEIRPITGANPLRPSLGVQRTAADDADAGVDDAELPSPWWSPAPPPQSPDAARSAGAPESLGAPAATMIQRSAIGSSSAGTPREITRARAARSSQAVTAARSAPVAAPVQRSVAQVTRPSTLPQPAGTDMRSTSAIARSEAGSGTTTPPSVGVLGAAPVVQTSLATPPIPGPAPSMSGAGPATVQREDSAPAAPAQAATTAPSERDLDELAQALFGRIRGRIRNDLIYDREAKGLTFDNV